MCLAGCAVASDTNDPLVVLNNAFHTEYKDSQDTMLPKAYLIQVRKNLFAHTQLLSR